MTVEEIEQRVHAAMADPGLPTAEVEAIWAWVVDLLQDLHYTTPEAHAAHRGLDQLLIHPGLSLDTAKKAFYRDPAGITLNPSWALWCMREPWLEEHRRKFLEDCLRLGYGEINAEGRYKSLVKIPRVVGPTR